MIFKPRVAAATKCFGVLGANFDDMIVVLDGAWVVSPLLAKEGALQIGLGGIGA